MKPIAQGPLTAFDVREAVGCYRREADVKTALAFIDAVEEASRQISRWPASGATRFAEWLGIPDLRTATLQRFPYVMFYFEYQDYVDVWRVLHTRRDIPDVLA